LAAFSEKALESSVRKIHDAGFDTIEIVFEYPFFYGDNYLEQQIILKKLKRELKLEFTVHAPLSYELFSHVDPIFRKHLHKMIANSAEVANYVDSEIFIIHGGLIPSINFLLQSRKKSVKLFIDELKPLVKRNPDLKVCIENLSRPPSIGHKLEECKIILEAIPDLGFCWDVPHSFLAGQLEDFMKLTIDHVHVADCDSIKDRHWPLGKGEIPWKKVKESLKKRNYKGQVMLESFSIENAVKSRNYWNNL
jgi:sugar phosphate isomerase/epimerase